MNSPSATITLRFGVQTACEAPVQETIYEDEAITVATTEIRAKGVCALHPKYFFHPL